MEFEKILSSKEESTESTIPSMWPFKSYEWKRANRKPKKDYIDCDQTHPANPGHSPEPIYIENRR